MNADLPPSSYPAKFRGFTLVELAIVLIIVTLLIGGMLMSLSAQQNTQAIRDTETRLAMIQEAILGFAAANGRLPCPANTTSNGQESPAGGGICTNPNDGFVPAVTLGIAPVDSQGFAIDGWGQRIRYAVSRDPSSAILASNSGGPWRHSFTTIDGMRTTGIASLHPDLQVCSTGPAAAGNTCAANTDLTSSAAAVFYSTGANAASGGTGVDEAENPNPNSASVSDRVFVSHTQSPSSATNGEFDDIVVWLSPNILFNRMIAAGRLP